MADGPTLNPRQKRFCREYLRDMSPADAYIRAGYEVENRQTACIGAFRLMKKLWIMAEIERLQRRRMKKLDLSADWVVQGFVAEYLRASKKGDSASALRALENVGKFLGIYERDNRQRAGGDAEAVKRRILERLGIDVDVAFAPPAEKAIEVLPAGAVTDS